MFSPEVCDRIGYYIYLLLDGDQAFYVGKGKGNRAFQHAIAAADLSLGDEDPTSAKLGRIRDTLRRGGKVDVVLLRHGIATEEEAYRLESLLIDLFAGEYGFKLENLMGGHHAHREGVMTADEVVALYEAPPIELDDTPIVMFRIPKLWHRGMSKEELYEATHGWWRISPGRAARAQYVFAVSKGVVREIYRPRSWRKRERGEPDWTEAELMHPRYGFDGEIAADAPAEWKNHNVLEFLPRGFQGTFRYNNC